MVPLRRLKDIFNRVRLPRRKNLLRGINNKKVSLTQPLQCNVNEWSSMNSNAKSEKGVH